MNRRQAIKTTFTAAALASVLRPGMLAAQETTQKPAAVEGNTLCLQALNCLRFRTDSSRRSGLR